ncbi:hypothetical protein CHISP_0982 [Chitinispirillum alkaliphilum]|nr:hypothetical protein CHISP_0982 [Chitinispirillum alkaliphilum]
MTSCLTPYQQVRRPLSADAEEEKQQKILLEEDDKHSFSVRFQFSSDSERNRFVEAFNQFLLGSHYDYEVIDSGRDFLHLKMIARKIPDITAEEEESLGFSGIDDFSFDDPFIESLIETTDTASLEDPFAPLPTKGGSAVLYSPRPFIDNIVSELLNLHPFSESEDGGAFIITDSSHRRVELRLNGRIVNASGQSLSALDLIHSWTNLIRQNPAEGLALFRNVQGVDAFIRGQEPVIRGFYAVDRNTVQLRMERPDPNALTRLRTSRLLWSGLKMGPYYTQTTSANQINLQPNANTQSSTPFLDEVTLRLGGDSNPVLSFSLGRFSAVTLYSSADIQYAKNNLQTNSALHRLPSERYFVSSRVSDRGVRGFIARQLRPADILNNFVKAEGEPISAVESDYIDVGSPQAGSSSANFEGSLRLIFVQEDPVSKAIAEKMLADMSHQGIRLELAGVDYSEYQRALVKGEYDLAIGWVGEQILTDPAERLRLASIWFDDETDANLRIQEYKEIPLFSINRYLLTRDDMALHRGRLKGVFIVREDLSPEENHEELSEIEAESEVESEAESEIEEGFFWGLD